MLRAAQQLALLTMPAELRDTLHRRHRKCISRGRNSSAQQARHHLAQ